MIWKPIARLILARVLDQKTKERVIDALRQAAKDTETTIDDDAVAVFSEIWSIAVPILVGRL